MAQIGTLTDLAVVGGRLNISAPKGLEDGARTIFSPGRKTKPWPIRTIVTAANYQQAWSAAALHRGHVGYLAPFTDGGGIICEAALIADCRTMVRATANGAEVETLWQIAPAPTWGIASKTLDYLPATTSPATFVPEVFGEQLAGNDAQAPTVGNTTWRTATGDVQWPLDAAQVAAVVLAAQAMEAEDAISAPEEGQGALETQATVASEAAAFSLQAQCRNMIGPIPVAVDLGGLSIQCAVIDVEVRWQPVVSDAGQVYLVIANWTLKPQSQSIDGYTTRSRVVVQTAQRWGDWETHDDFKCTKAAAGLGLVAGSATASSYLGEYASGALSRTNEPIDLTGRWLRLMLKSELKKPDATAIWHGIVESDNIQAGSDDPGAPISWLAVGLVASLKKIMFTRWWEVAQDLGELVDPGEVLPVNSRLGGDAGVGAADFDGLIVHDRTQEPPEYWTIKQFVTTLVKAINLLSNAGPQWGLTGQTEALNFEAQLDIRGKTAADALIEAINPRWGLGFSVAVDGDNFHIRVHTGVAAPVTIPGMGNDLPANDQAAAVDLTARKYQSVTLRRSAVRTYDHIYIEGDNTLTCTTMRFSGSGAWNDDGLWEPNDETWLTKGWTEDAETEWDAASEEDRNSPRLSHVWRRFVPRSDWKGQGWVAAAVPSSWAIRMRRGLTIDNSSESGDLEVDTTGAWPKPEDLRFTRELPIWSGKDWANYGSDPGFFPGDELEGPLIFHIRNTTEWYPITDEYTLQVSQDACAVMIGRSAADAEKIAGLVDGADELLAITIGLIHPLPWRVSWSRATNERPRDQDRTIIIKTDYQFRRIERYTVLGVENPTTLQQRDDALEIGKADVVNQARQLLELAKNWHAQNDKVLEYTTKGEILTDAAALPGGLITTAKLRLGPYRTWTPTVNALITGVQWNFQIGEESTSITTDPTWPAVGEVLLGVPAQPANWHGGFRNAT